jgi:death-on-curing protein
MNRLTKAQIINMHRLLIQEMGGSEGIKDQGLLDSALNAPFQTFDGEDLYKTIRAKAYFCI